MRQAILLTASIGWQTQYDDGGRPKGRFVGVSVSWMPYEMSCNECGFNHHITEESIERMRHDPQLIEMQVNAVVRCCVKGGIGYWNKIRKDFPERFKQMAQIERAVGATCLKDEKGRIWLDELDANRGDSVKAIEPDCSLFCAIEFANIEDPQTCKVMQGEISINSTQ